MRETLTTSLSIGHARIRAQNREMLSSTSTVVIFAAITSVVTYLLVRPSSPSAYTIGKIYRESVQLGTQHVSRAFSTLIVLAGTLYVMRGATNISEFDNRKRYTEIHSTTLEQTIGIFVSEVYLLLQLSSVALIGIVVAFVIGSDNPFAGVQILALAIWGLTASLFIGIPVGILVNHIIVSKLNNKRLKLVAGASAIALFELLVFKRDVYVSVVAETPLGTLPPALLSPSLTAFDLSIQWIALTFSLLLLFIASAQASSLLLTGLWTPNTTQGGTVTNDSRSDSFATLYSKIPTSQRSALAVVSLTCKVVLRRPATLLYSAIPVFGIGMMSYQVITGEQSISLLPVYSVLLGTISVGMSFSLNPLGMDADGLAWLFSGNVDARDYVLGTAVAAAAITTPVFGIITGFAALFAGYSALKSIVAVFLAVSAITTGAFVSTAIGVRLPNLKTKSFGSEVQIALPTKTAVVPYLGYFLIVSGITTLTLATTRYSSIITVVPGLLLLAIVAFTAYQYSKGLIEYSPLELTEADSYPSFRSVLPEPIAAFWETVGVNILFLALAAATGFALRWGVIDVGRIPFLAQVGVTAGAYLGSVSLYRLYDPQAGSVHWGLSMSDGIPAAIGFTILLGMGVLATEYIAVEQATSQIGAAGQASPFELILGGVIIIPIVEELTYRGVIQTRLSDAMPSSQAICLTSAFFTLPHLPNYLAGDLFTISVGLGVVFAQSLVIGSVYEKTNSISSGILIHSVYNLVAFAPY